MIKISVILPVYNSQNTIYDCINSVISAAIGFECQMIIVNDGSNDDTVEILKHFSNILVPNFRLQVVNNPKNSGIVYSLNKAIAHIDTDCKYIFRMDSDDLCTPDRFAETIMWMEDRHLDVCGSSVVTFSKFGSVGRESRPRDNLICKFYNFFGPPFIHPTVCFRAATCNDLLKYDQGWDGVEDWVLWKKLSKQGLKFGNNPKALLHYYIDVSVGCNKRDPNPVRRALAEKVFFPLRIPFILSPIRDILMRVVKLVSFYEKIFK